MNKQVQQIKAEIERLSKKYDVINPLGLLDFINSLEEEPQVKASPYQKDIASYVTDFEYCIQEGDKITTNEDGTKFNISQLERVAVSEDLKKEPKSQRMISAEVKEALYNTPENLDLEKEIETHLKECLDVKFPTTDIELIKKDVRYTAEKFFELGLKAQKGEEV